MRALCKCGHAVIHHGRFGCYGKANPDDICNCTLSREDALEIYILKQVMDKLINILKVIKETNENKVDS